MGAKREYTAIFAIGAKLLGSFRGAMNAAQARLRGLSATARRVTMGIGKLAGAFSGLFAIFTTFLAANILGKIFSTALDEAVEAEERTRDLIDSLMQMDEIRKKGLPEAQKQLALIFQHNKALEAQGVLHKDVLDTMSVQLAMGRIPSKDIQDSVDVMQNLLIKTKGVRGATEEAAKAMGQKWVMAARKGTIKGMGLGIPVMTPEQAKAFKEMTFPERVHKLIELGKAVGNLNEQSRNTPVGRVQLFQNAIQDLAQDVGEELWPALADVADAWREALPELKPMLIGGLKVVLGLVRDLGKYVRKELIPWWRQFQKSERFKQIKGVLSWIHAHIKPIAITVGVIVAALAGLAVLAPLIGVITAIANPIGLIVVGILAVVAAVGLLYANWGKVQEMFPATAAVVEHFIEGFKVSFKAGFDFVIAIWKTLVALFTGDWQGVGDAWKKVWNDMGAIAEWWKTTLIAVAKAVGQAFKDYFLKVFEDIKSIWTWMKGFSWSGIKKMFAEGKDAATAYGEQVSTGQAGGAGGYGGAAAAVAPVGSAVAAAAHALPPEALAKVQAERADIVKELMRPEIRNLVSATLATESGTAEGQKDVLEAMVNRAAAQKRAGSYKGIENVIKGGFYGPYNRGETAAVMAKGLSDERSKQVSSIVESIGAGRNALRGMTDQGMVNEIKGYKENIGGEYYGFMEGLGDQYKTAAYLESQKAAAAAANPPPDETPKYAKSFATGGVVTKPTLAMVGDAGPEAMVPLGRGRGRGREAGGTHVNFTPNITINGNATPEAQEAMETSLRKLSQEFVSNFKRAQGHERRLSYEGGYG